jgi:hypothetical protein
MSDTKQLLSDILSLFHSVGVRPGVGPDGQLMTRIQAELGEGAPTPLLAGFNPNMRMACPLCKAPDFNECGCPADLQMAAMV